MKKKNKDKNFLEEVRDAAAVLFPKETFDTKVYIFNDRTENG